MRLIQCVLGVTTRRRRGQTPALCFYLGDYYKFTSTTMCKWVKVTHGSIWHGQRVLTLMVWVVMILEAQFFHKVATRTIVTTATIANIATFATLAIHLSKGNVRLYLKLYITALAILTIL